MTLDEIRALPNRERDRMIAEALGWYAEDLPDAPFYSTDLNACAGAEQETRVRYGVGFESRYLRELGEGRTIYDQVTATARQRAEALAEVLTEKR